jgi:FkbM family methyltransferase
MFDWLINAMRPYQFKGKPRLFSPLVPRAGIVNALVHGFKVDLDLSDHIQRLVYMGCYERCETDVFKRYLNPGMTVVDVGANIGYFTLLAARMVGRNGRVVAIEPSGYVAERLERTVLKNKIDNIVILRTGLGRNSGETHLPIPGPGNHTPSMLDLDASGSTVPLRTMDEVFDTLQLNKIDFMKIDVEGYEPEVFAGASKCLSLGRIHAILFELNRYWLCRAHLTPEVVYKSIIKYGFEDKTGTAYDCQAELSNRFLTLPLSRREIQ